MKARMLHLGLAICVAIVVTTNSRAGLFDPTQPSAAGGAAAGVFEGNDAFHLNATRITPGKRTVIINGVAVDEGGRIGKARVLGITHGQVQLDVEGEKRTLRIAPNEVKKTP